jgi:hypothetical protein
MTEHRRFPGTRVTAVLLAAVAIVLGSSGGPPNGKTGAPGEGTCNDCHAGPAGTPDSTSLAGVPGNVYVPGTTYNMTLSLQWSSQRRWGFELTALTTGGGSPGQLIVSDPVNTQYSASGSGYLKQTSSGTFNGTPFGVSWQFQWQAPAAGTGPVVFYWCANACNGNNGTTGDAVCRDSLVVTEQTGIAGAVDSSGRLFLRYRNPTRERVILEYKGNAAPVRIYSTTGRLVRRLEPVRTGDILRVVWDGRDHTGRLVPAAGYVLRPDGTPAAVRVEVVR